MKRFLLLIITLVSISIADATEINYYRGTIGKYPVELTIIIPNSGQATGFYRYLNKGSWLSLSGSLSGSDLSLQEHWRRNNSDEDEMTGEFKGEYSDSVFSGKWLSGDRKRELDFLLTTGPDTMGLNFAGIEYTGSATIGDHSNSSDINALYVKGKCSFANELNNFIYSKCYYDGMFSDSNGNQVSPPSNLNYPAIIANYIANPSPDYNMEWNAGASVIWNGSGVLTMDNGVWEYGGGAHGVGTSDYNCFDLRTGNKIEESDIFLEGYEEPLRLKAVEHLDHEDGTMFIERDSLQLNGNFYLTPEGIGYFYNSYEIACYMCGTPETFIPWSEINKWIDPNGPMAWVRK